MPPLDTAIIDGTVAARGRYTAGAMTARRALTMMEAFHSPFYAPALIAARGGYFAEEGFDVSIVAASPGRGTADAILDGSVDFAVSGLMRSFKVVDEGGPPIVHFAAVNDRNGFFLLGREPRPAFAWSDLAGRTVISFGGAPTPYYCMLSVLRRHGIDPARVTFVRELPVPEAVAAFRAGRGDFLECGPPVVDRLAADGTGHLVASMGEATGPVPFSSLMTAQERVHRDRAELVRLVRALHRAQQWIAHARADELARTLGPSFADIEPPLLARILDRYRAQHTWPATPMLDRSGYERLQEILLGGGFIARRHPFETLVDTSIATEATRE
jgi:NitT/TauT family transport system substrate-binding protein